MTDTPTTRTRNTDRAETTTMERKGRSANASQDPSLRRFNVSDSVLDHDKFIYRAAADTDLRITELVETGEYFFVQADGKTDGGKGEGDRPAGALKYRSGTVDGQPVFTYLLAKPKQFADEDRAAKDAKLKARETARLTKAPTDMDAEDGAYVTKR